MFKLLDPNNPSDFEFLSQMHHLRHRIFVQNLQWRKGIRACSQMEFDDFDHSDCRYLVRLNSNHQIDACTRLTLTCFPYLLSDVFSDYIENISIPKVPTIAETSRFCADNTAPTNAAGLIMAAMLELGIKAGINQYVSFSDARIKPVVLKYGWHATELGSRKITDGTVCVAFSYDVTEEYYKKVKKAVRISGDLIDCDVSINDMIASPYTHHLVKAANTDHIMPIRKAS
jgi:acyl-homoserine lactone synthase